MAKKVRIAFDLDGVIVDKPPLIPKSVLEWFFRGGKREPLRFRFPRWRLEQLIRRSSHLPPFRPLIKENVDFIKTLAVRPEYEVYLISSRYSFLAPLTENLLEKNQIKNIFKATHLNLQNKPPHLFKEEMLRKIKADIFVDDDLEVLDYLREKIDGSRFCLFRKGKTLSLPEVLGIK